MLLPVFFLFIVVFIACLLVLDFFGVIKTDGYVEGNAIYAAEYKAVLNENITKVQNGYVPLERILDFYHESHNLSFSNIYEMNLDKELKRVKPLSSICQEKENRYYGICQNLLLQNNKDDTYSIKPFTYPLDFSKVVVTSFFMEERIIFGKSDIHKAWDFAAPAKTEVFSVCDGIVTKVSFPYSQNEADLNGGYGNYIQVECLLEEEKYLVTYGHLYPNSNQVKEKENVFQGQRIASVGTTGSSTGNHLHYQVQKGKTYLDGMSFINFSDKPYTPNKPDYFQPIREN